MKNKVILKIIAIIMIITISLIPTYVDAAKVPGANASASEIDSYMQKNKNLKSVNSATLKAWQSTIESEPSGRYSSLLTTIKKEAKTRLETANNLNDVNNLLDIVKDPALLTDKGKKNVEKIKRKKLGR